MAREQRALTRQDTEKVFRIATKGLPKRFQGKLQNGMTDSELTEALEQVLGVFGGSCGPGQMSVVHQASGLKIWGAWHIVNHHTEAPLFQGRGTLAMARHIYAIKDPGDDQMSLL